MTTIYPEKYKVYIVLFAQSGTNAPVPTILENTIGDIVWTYNSEGTYMGTLSGAFPSGKVFCINTGSVIINGLNDQNFILYLGRINDNVLSLQTLDSITFTPKNGCLLETPIEIRVYN